MNKYIIKLQNKSNNLQKNISESESKIQDVIRDSERIEKQIMAASPEIKYNEAIKNKEEARYAKHSDIYNRLKAKLEEYISIQLGLSLEDKPINIIELDVKKTEEELSKVKNFLKSFWLQFRKQCERLSSRN